MLTLETMESLKVSDDVMRNAFNKGILEAVLEQNSKLKLDLRLTIFVDDNCVSCLQVSKVKEISIDEQLNKFAIELDNDIKIRCDRIDVKKWNEE